MKFFFIFLIVFLICISYVSAAQCVGVYVGNTWTPPNVPCEMASDENPCSQKYIQVSQSPVLYQQCEWTGSGPPQFEDYLCQACMGGPCSGVYCTVPPPEIPVTNCMIINSPGNYGLTVNITTNTVTGICIDINANNVVLNCNGNQIKNTYGTAGAKGIDISGTAGAWYKNVSIVNCNISRWSYGVYPNYVKDLNITSDIFFENVYPIYSSYINETKIADSNFSRTTGYTMLSKMRNAQVTNNHFEETATSYGVINYGAGTSGINQNFNNTFERNTIKSVYAIYDYYTYGSVYANNSINGSSYVLYSPGYSVNLSLYNNKIIYVTTSPISIPTSSTNPLFNTSLTATQNIMGGSYMGGNYWGTASKTGFSDKCPDADQNGICDTTFRIGTYYYYDYLPISNVTISFLQTIVSPSNASYVGPYPQIVANIRANVGWKNTTMMWKNSSMGDWEVMTDCYNQSINGLVNINYKCIWNNTNTSTGGEGYQVLVQSYDLSNNQLNNTNLYYVDLSLPQIIYVDSDFPEYPYSRFRPSVNQNFILSNTLTKLNANNLNLVSYYNFDTDTTSVVDKVGSNPGTLTSGASIQSIGFIGKSLKLDGVNDYVDIGNSTNLSFTNNFTLSAWVKTSKEGYVIDKDPTTGYVYRDVRGTMSSCNNGWNYFMGYQFNTTKAGQITEVCGIYNGAKNIKIQDSSFNVLYTGTLTASNTVNTLTWTCQAITPVTVQADQIYYIGVNVAGVGGCYDYPSLSTSVLSNGINIKKVAYQGSASQFSSGSITLTSGYAYGLVDFKIEYGKADLPFALSTIKGGKFMLINKSTEYSILSGVNTSDNQWHLMTATYEGDDIQGNMSLYVDGVIVNSTGSYKGNIPSNTLPVWIGRHYNPNEVTGYFDGSIDEVMLFNKSLHPDEVLNIYNNQTTRFLTSKNYNLIQNISTGADTLSVTTNFFNFLDTSINLIIGYFDSDWTYSDSQQLTSGLKAVFNISTSANNISLNYTLNGTGFYSPEIYGNINMEESSTSSARQTSIRNGETIILRVNTSDANSGIANVSIDLTNLNGSNENKTMILQSGSLPPGEWGYFNITVLNVNNTEGNKEAFIYASDTVGNIRGSDTFNVFFDNTPTNITYLTNLSGVNIVKNDNISISWSIADSSPLSPNGYYILSNNISSVWNNDTQGYLSEDGNGQIIFYDAQVGYYAYQLFTFDDAGNQNDSGIISFEVNDLPPVEIINTYPNNNSVFRDKNQSVSFEYVYMNADNCSLYVNGELIQTRTDTNESNTAYWFDYRNYNYGENKWYVACSQGVNEYYSGETIFNITPYKLGLVLIQPLNNLSIEQNTSFNYTINISCRDNDCESVNGTLNYNSYNFTLDILNTQNATLNENESILINWTINGTGLINNSVFNTSLTQDGFSFLNTTQDIYVNITITYPIPPVPLKIEFIPNTPSNNTNVSTSLEANVSIVTNSLTSLIWNWNGTNYTMYNDSLILMYNFDNLSSLGESDTKVVDLSKYNKTSTFAGGAIINQSGKYGSALSCIGTNDYLDITGTVIGTDWTIATWFVYPLPSTGNWNTLVRGSLHHIIVQTSGADRNLGVYTGGGFQTANYNMKDLSNDWHHLTATASASGTIFYIDGAYVGNTSAVDTDNIIALGNYQGGGQQFGTIDEVRIYNRSLLAEEVKEVYSSNLNKYNPTQWYFYINQSINHQINTSSNYTYQAYAETLANQTEERLVEIYNPPIPPTPTLTITNVNPTVSGNVTQNVFFNYTTEVCCYDADCGNMNVSLDPQCVGTSLGTGSWLCEGLPTGEGCTNSYYYSNDFADTYQCFDAGFMCITNAPCTPPVGPSSKSGLVNTTIGATPFYTTNLNPQNVTLNASQCINVTWSVNATGNATNGLNHTFFAFVNASSTLHNITNKINLTIVEGGEAPPSGDSCTPPSLNNDWIVNWKDNCYLNSDTKLGTGYLIMNGTTTGSFTINNTGTLTTRGRNLNAIIGSRFIILKGGRLVLK